MGQSVTMFQQPSKTPLSTWSITTFSSVGVLLWGPLFQLAGAQLFADERPVYGTISYETFGLSQACVDAMNTRVSCHLALAIKANFQMYKGHVDVLSPVSLEKICVPKCRDDLQELRTKIASSCNKQTDHIKDYGTLYPAIFLIDHYIYKWDVSCYKDKSSGQPCDLYLWHLYNESNELDLCPKCDLYLWGMQEPKELDMCSDCVLGRLSVRLSSPLGYYDETVDQFSSIKAQCGTAAASYTYTKTTYTTSTVSKTSAKTTTTRTCRAAPTEPARPLKCDRKYTIAKGDTCESIALAQNASTYDIVTLNSLMWNSGCHLPKRGGEICLPSPCTPYQIDPMDTCRSIANKWNVTVDDIVAWNEIFTPKCGNIHKWDGTVICVRLPSITTFAQQTMDLMREWDERTKPPAPGTDVDSCNAWHNTWDEEITEIGFDMAQLNKCMYVASSKEVRMKDLVAWNPSLKDFERYTCKLDPLYSYCIDGPRPQA